jgi:hypothetical protein
MACTPSRIVFIRNAVLDSVAMKCPKPCRLGNLCDYVSEEGGPCTYVHPGEQGVVRMVVPAHSFTSPRDGKQIFMPARVKLFMEDGDSRTARYAPYYARMKLGLSWPDWCEREGLALPPAGAVLPAWEDPKCIRLCYQAGLVSEEKELLFLKQEERLAALERRLLADPALAELRDLFYQQTNRTPVPGGLRPGPAAAAAIAAGEDEGVVEFSQEELELAPFAQAAELSMTLATVREEHARQLAAMEERRRAAAAAEEQRARAAFAAQQQQWLFAQQQQYQQWLFAQQQQYQQWLSAQQQVQQPVFTEVQQKNLLGEQLYPIVKDQLDRSLADREAIGWTGPLFTAGKITGMLLEGCSVDELRELLEDDTKLSELMLEACEVLAAAPAPAPPVPAPAQQAQNVEIRPAAAVLPAVPGNTAMAAAADDTVRQLLEDVRRIDAGLPLKELPPSMTSYEPQADGSVRIQRTVFPVEPRHALRRQAVERHAAQSRAARGGGAAGGRR